MKKHYFKEIRMNKLGSLLAVVRCAYLNSNSLNRILYCPFGFH